MGLTAADILLLDVDIALSDAASADRLDRRNHFLCFRSRAGTVQLASDHANGWQCSQPESRQASLHRTCWRRGVPDLFSDVQQGPLRTTENLRRLTCADRVNALVDCYFSIRSDSANEADSQLTSGSRELFSSGGVRSSSRVVNPAGGWSSVA